MAEKVDLDWGVEDLSDGQEPNAVVEPANDPAQQVSSMQSPTTKKLHHNDKAKKLTRNQLTLKHKKYSAGKHKTARVPRKKKTTPLSSHTKSNTNIRVPKSLAHRISWKCKLQEEENHVLPPPPPPPALPPPPPPADQAPAPPPPQAAPAQEPNDNVRQVDRDRPLMEARRVTANQMSHAYRLSYQRRNLRPPSLRICCSFCLNRGSHYTADCQAFTSQEARLHRIESRHLCRACLFPAHEECRERCRGCGREAHNQAICTRSDQINKRGNYDNIFARALQDVLQSENPRFLN